MKKIIFSVGRDLPSEDCEFIPFDSDRSLSDADIILYWPQLSDKRHLYESYAGKHLYPQHVQVETRIQHWRSELSLAMKTARLVIVFLSPLDEAYYHTGDQTFSGTGRSRVTTNIVNLTSSYRAIPGITSVLPKSGAKIQSTRDSSLIASYWKEFSPLSFYRVVIEGKFTKTFLQTRGGEGIVGAMNQFESGGSILYLPSLEFDEDAFRRATPPYWKVEGLRFGGRLLSSIVAIYDSLRSGSISTPPPAWVADQSYVLKKEVEIDSAMKSAREKIETLQSKVEKLDVELSESKSLKKLLYEQGKPLEGVVHKVLSLFGFQVSHFQENSSEFDVLGESEEGRFLGEIEGKDNRPINIDKLSQLERNLQEDFAREEVTTFAKGILFGNAYRLSIPQKREGDFTAKCLEAAKRAKIALVRTVDLFGPARYLQDNQDADYARQCRRAMFETEGDVVKFPAIPNSVGDVNP